MSEIKVTKGLEPVFVFGSNLRGVHGAGAAKWALENRGAKYWQGQGYQGNSYAIPTKDENIETLPLERINEYVKIFLIFAEQYPEIPFQLTPIGCGLAGLTPAQIAPMFEGAPSNVQLPLEFIEVLYGDIE
jgi:hypothetical protein